MSSHSASRVRAQTPDQALAALVAGNRRFVDGQPLHGHDVTAVAVAATGAQEPDAVVLGCLDSRVPIEAIFDQTFGSVCVVRTGGHVLDRAVLGSVEFAVSELAVPLVMVLGHERCGAVAGTLAALRSGQRPGGPLGYLVDEIEPAVSEVGVDHPQVLTWAVQRHVGRTVTALGEHPVLAEAARSGRIGIVGAVYDLDSGRVRLLDRR